MSVRSSTDWLVHGLLHAMAANYRWRPQLRKYLKSRDGWMNFTVGVRTFNDSVRQSIHFHDGRASVRREIPANADCVLQFKNDAVVKKMLDLAPEEVMNLLLRNELSLRGNLSTLSKFNFLLSALLETKHRRMRAQRGATAPAADAPADAQGAAKLAARRKAPLVGANDAGAPWLDDPYLSRYSLDDFPRLREFLEIHLTQKPEICAERAVLLTAWRRAHGDAVDDSDPPVVRQARVLKHILENKQPRLRKNDLLAGTTTTKEIGVVLYPETHAGMIWGELLSVPERNLNPYNVAEETRRILHFDVLPYWEKRNVREWVRQTAGEPLCQQLDERFAVYFLWKTVAVSHTIPDFPKLLRLGAAGIVAELRAEAAKTPPAQEEKLQQLAAMEIALAGLVGYAANLAAQARREAVIAADPPRKAELLALADMCEHAPRHPARTLHEAINALWIAWIALHMENTNAGLSLGRLDQTLQPFFAADIAKLPDAAARERYLARAIELAGCFFLRCTDHLPMVPDIGNFLFGGSSSDQAVTLGGLRPDGGSAVNDMTYVLLKVTELLNIRDPNVNARYAPGVNTDGYLRRLCEVNYLTAATPSMHNDRAVLAALEEFHYPLEHVRDWSATGCVEPTISGRHIGHTNCMMMNMVAALEMALHDGRHPLIDWSFGPATGDVDRGAFAAFDDFYDAFAAQFRFLIEQSCEYNNLLGKAHGQLRPTPLLSSLIDGCAASGRDASRGGASYNTSGAACIGLADVVDSLMAVKTLVYEQRKVSLADLRRATMSNFAGDPALLALIRSRAPKFGSGDPDATAMANRVAHFAHDCYAAQPHYRGGRYTSGFWSMSNHVAFGCLTGALPSGRLAGKPFTPGLTPQPLASDNLLDPIHDVASLDPKNLTNNIAFNVKVVPGARDGRREAVERLYHYVKTYFELGGMQMQLNVVTSALLRDAMAHPEKYRNLLVRISGYNAYFVTLNRDMQLELIDRAEYGIS